MAQTTMVDEVGSIQEYSDKAKGCKGVGVGSVELNNQMIGSLFKKTGSEIEGKDGLGTSLNGFFKEGMLTGCSSGQNEESCFVEKIKGRGQSILGA